MNVERWVSSGEEQQVSWRVARSAEYLLLAAGTAALLIPTMVSVARLSWSTEQGAHGPIVLATGLWLLWRALPDARRVAQPGSWLLAGPGLLLTLATYLIARITGILEVEAFAMYGALLFVAYLFLGGSGLRQIWFPIVYLAFLFPPPDTLVAMITQPVKIEISKWAVALLYTVGYPVGSSGVTIQIAQYQLLVAAACAGLNSLISLSAIGLFYVYIRHNANWRYALLLTVAILPIAIFANFVRVVLLILITYYFGDAVAQGFIHDFAGLTMFTIAVLAVFGIDALAAPLRERLQ